MADLTDEMQESVMIRIGLILLLSILSRDCVLGKTQRDFRKHAWNLTTLYLEMANIEILLYQPLDKWNTYDLQLFLSRPFEKGRTIVFSTLG